jgi:uncharacterized protein with HEPN domain
LAWIDPAFPGCQAHDGADRHQQFFLQHRNALGGHIEAAQHMQAIVDNIDTTADYAVRMDFAAFVGGRKTVYALVRPLEIVSEASRRLPVEVKDWHSEIDSVDGALMWHTVRQSLAARPQGLAALRGVAAAELERLRSA